MSMLNGKRETESSETHRITHIQKEEDIWNQFEFIFSHTHLQTKTEMRNRKCNAKTTQEMKIKTHNQSGKKESNN